MDIARGLPISRLRRPSFQDIKAPPSERRPGVAPGYLPMVVRAILPYLEIECLQVLPAREDLDALITIFKQEVHPILPLVDFAPRVFADVIDRENPATIVLRQAICLAACKNVSARRYLNLPKSEDGALSRHTPREFADRLFGVLKIALDIGLVDDKLELIQVLALMTFHSYGPDGDDEVARLCGQAVHYAYSIGLHYPSQAKYQISEARRVELLCSLFVLDKIIATVTGRPTNLRGSEIYLPAQDEDIFEALSPGLRLAFRLSQMLDRVLDLYRPQRRSETVREECLWEASWLEFDDLAREYEIEAMHPSLQACLELLYHTIGVLSYRTTPILAIQNDDSEDLSPPVTQISKLKQSYCAQRIFCLLGLEISMFPFVPYASSLSLTVALRNLQHATLVSSKMMAKDEVERQLRVLEGLAEIYSHAESAGVVGRKILQSLLSEG